MREDKGEIEQKKLQTSGKDASATSENNAEQKKQKEEKNRRERNVKKFLWWLVGNGALQLLVGVISSLFYT